MWLGSAHGLRGLWIPRAVSHSVLCPVDKSCPKHFLFLVVPVPDFPIAQPICRSHQMQACAACAKAKRKCLRQSPACLRCRSRGLDCQYPAKRPSRWVLMPDAPPETSSEEYSPPRLDVETAFRGLDPFLSLGEEMTLKLVHFYSYVEHRLLRETQDGCLLLL